VTDVPETHNDWGTATLCRQPPRNRLHASFRIRTALIFCLAIILLTSIGGCAGYRIGTESLYPADVRTVFVPMIESTSFRRNLGEQLTEAVIKEIELNTDFDVVDTPQADSVLAARIVGEGKSVVIQRRSGYAREVETELQIEVRWIDRQHNELRASGTVSVPPEMTHVGATASLVPEVGQSVATAQQVAISRLAKQIVGLMENPW